MTPRAALPTAAEDLLKMLEAAIAVLPASERKRILRGGAKLLAARRRLKREKP